MHFGNIISASRRCDLVAFYPDFLIESLSRFPPEENHSIVLWTKDPTNLLANDGLQRKLLKYDSIYLLLSVTGLGGTFAEPSVPAPGKIYPMLGPLTELLGGPEHIAIRYDPLIHIIKPDSAEEVSNINDDIARSLMDIMQEHGIQRMIISVAEAYTKAVARMGKLGMVLAPNYQDEAAQFIAGILISEAKHRNISIDNCASPGTSCRGCIDGQILMSIHPHHFNANTTKDRNQRPFCKCHKSIDIGKWFNCPHGCIYCYGNPIMQRI